MRDRAHRKRLSRPPEHLTFFGPCRAALAWGARPRSVGGRVRADGDVVSNRLTVKWRSRRGVACARVAFPSLSSKRVCLAHRKVAVALPRCRRRCTGWRLFAEVRRACRPVRFRDLPGSRPGPRGVIRGHRYLSGVGGRTRAWRAGLVVVSGRLVTMSGPCFGPICRPRRLCASGRCARLRRWIDGSAVRSCFRRRRGRARRVRRWSLLDARWPPARPGRCWSRARPGR